MLGIMICARTLLTAAVRFLHGVCSGREERGAFGYSVHPLFAVPSKTETYQELHKSFFAIEGDSEHLAEMVALIADEDNVVQVIDAAEKVRYHAAAVLASNQVIALYQRACDELVRCGFTPENAEKALAPLFLGNAEHVAQDGVIASLTGPAERGDTATIQKHLDCLDDSTRRSAERYPARDCRSQARIEQLVFNIKHHYSSLLQVSTKYQGKVSPALRRCKKSSAVNSLSERPIEVFEFTSRLQQHQLPRAETSFPLPCPLQRLPGQEKVRPRRAP